MNRYFLIAFIVLGVVSNGNTLAAACAPFMTDQMSDCHMPCCQTQKMSCCLTIQAASTPDEINVSVSAQLPPAGESILAGSNLTDYSSQPFIYLRFSSDHIPPFVYATPQIGPAPPVLVA
jgi:hypothetical protein